MRIGKLEINGKTHPMCISGRVILAMQDRYEGTWEESIDKILAGENIFDYYWLGAEMMQAGKAYYEKTGQKCPEPLTQEDLLDILGLDDITKLASAVLEAATGSTLPDVELEDKGQKKEEPGK